MWRDRVALKVSGINLPRGAEHNMAEPIARRSMIVRRSPGGGALNVVARLIFPTLATGVLAALIAMAGKPAVVPLACTINWTMVGHTVIFTPDCPHPSPAPPNRAPSGNQPQPQQDPPAPN
jgi:hypothetical protein